MGGRSHLSAELEHRSDIAEVIGQKRYDGDNNQAKYTSHHYMKTHNKCLPFHI